ncbi:helix-turn-helix transcriptional regulator [Natronolimnohabitans innermongolicus]|uniref:DUF7343 domain-containing protein n=1 Tax=Natronolimnohabitans innermongolicus JCM 12255 TaxID=1227499 RepID=L9WTP8_9EURY|nr:helix-turn-helix domain-containing protein [Natronolimnohabitans innermongolicus]ELY52581.1 hypothetical protein C493_16070 [Natronolimnohabitans innermongolicus JCM 12255]
MSQRSPSTTGFVSRVRRLVRAPFETLRSLFRVDDPRRSPDADRQADSGQFDERDAWIEQVGRTDRDERTRYDERAERTHRPADRRREPAHDAPVDGGAVQLESNARSRSRSIDALLDPETGPTSRSDILEYGCLPSQYVRAVLEEHGGRMKQRQFVERYGWSPSTLSELLSDLEDRGVVERYRLGREKVVCLPTAADAGTRKLEVDAVRGGERDGL